MRTISAQIFAGSRRDNSWVNRASCSAPVKGSEALPLGARTSSERLRPSRSSTLTFAAVESALLAASTSSSRSSVVRSSRS